MRIVLKSETGNKVDTLNLKDAKPRQISSALNNKFVHGITVDDREVWIATDIIAYVIQDN
jgi:hypothetical protein